MHASDGQDNGHVTRKIYVVGPLINTSDVHFCPPVIAIHIPVTGIVPVTSN
jgi:hypothetical protein